MPDRAYRLSLDPTEALQLIADLVSTVDRKSLELVSSRVEQIASGAEVTLYIPEVNSQRLARRERNQRKEAYDEILDRYKQNTGQDPQRGPMPQNVEPLAAGLARALELSGGEDNIALPFDDQYLLVLDEAESERIPEVHSDLKFHGTSVTVATANSDSKSGSGQSVFLFHVKDDAARRGSFLSAVAGGFFCDCVVLRAYESDAGIVFLPSGTGIIPSPAALGYFGAIAISGPELFGGRSYEAQGGLLIAIGRKDGTADDATALPRIWHLGHLSFHSLDPAPRSVDKASFTIVEISESKDLLSSLRHQIEDAAQHPDEFIGYKLELRETRQSQEDIEFDRLLSQFADLEYRIAFVESIRNPRPQLFRFTARQLPALVDMLKGFPVNVLVKGRLEYAFSAETANEAGLHYVLVPPNVVSSEVDPIPRWEWLDDPPMRFWVDPMWGKHYGDRDSKSLVFVPHGTALFPSMHAWEPEDMDTYLRELMGQWFHGEFGVADIQEEPIYLFDGSPEPNSDIRISILDRTRFRPLVTQLGWLNDNLIPMDEVGVDEFIRGMATVSARKQMLDELTNRAKDAELSFEIAANGFRLHVAESTQALTNGLSRELGIVTDQAISTAKSLNELDGRLREMRQLHSDMLGIADYLSSLIRGVDEQQNEVDAHRVKIVDATQRKIRESTAARQRMETDVPREIERLDQARRSIIERLRALL